MSVEKGSSEGHHGERGRRAPGTQRHLDGILHGRKPRRSFAGRLRIVSTRSLGGRCHHAQRCSLARACHETSLPPFPSPTRPRSRRAAAVPESSLIRHGWSAALWRPRSAVSVPAIGRPDQSRRRQNDPRTIEPAPQHLAFAGRYSRSAAWLRSADDGRFRSLACCLQPRETAAG